MEVAVKTTMTVATIVLGSALLGGCVVDPGYGYGYGDGGYYAGGAYYVDRGGPPPRARGYWRDNDRHDRYDRRYDRRR